MSRKTPEQIEKDRLEYEAQAKEFREQKAKAKEVLKEIEFLSALFCCECSTLVVFTDEKREKHSTFFLFPFRNMNVMEIMTRLGQGLALLGVGEIFQAVEGDIGSLELDDTRVVYQDPEDDDSVFAAHDAVARICNEKLADMKATLAKNPWIKDAVDRAMAGSEVKLETIDPNTIN